MNTIDENSRLFLERIDMLYDELAKIKQGILAVQNGMSWEEAYNEEVLLEANQDQNQSSSYLSRMIEHLLKMKYCTSAVIRDCYDGWLDEAERYQNLLIDYTKWNSKKRYKNLINYLLCELQDSYETGIEHYRKATKKYPDLISGLELMPEECPWSFEELMELEIEELISDKFFYNE